MTASPDTPSGLIALVAAELAPIGPTDFGLQGSALHGSPRRFVWVPIDSPLGGPRKTGGGHVLDSIDLTFSVECWGHTFDDALYLVAALVSAIQRAWGGRNYNAKSVIPWEQRERHDGFVLALQVAVPIHLMAIDLSDPPLPVPAKTSALAPPPADGPPHPDDPSPVYAPTGTALVTILSVAEATPALSTPGDGELEGQES